jgi:hypothetical protein
VTTKQQARQQGPIIHTDTGDVFMSEIEEHLNDAFGKPDQFQGVEREAREAASKYVAHIFNGLSGEVLTDREEELTGLEARADGFFDGFMAAKTGTIRA